MLSERQFFKINIRFACIDTYEAHKLIRLAYNVDMARLEATDG